MGLDHQINEISMTALGTLGFLIGATHNFSNQVSLITFYNTLVNNTPKHNHEVGIIVAPHLKSSIKSYTGLSYRMMLLQLYAFPFDLNITKIYARISDKEEKVINDFYDRLGT